MSLTLSGGARRFGVGCRALHGVRPAICQLRGAAPVAPTQKWNYPSGSGFILNRAHDRREYGAASASGDRLRDDAADAQIARLRRGRDRRQ